MAEIRFMRILMLLGSIVLVGAAPAGAQSSVLEPPGALVAALDVALYNANAPRRVPTNTAAAELATDVLHDTLEKLLPGQLADSTAFHAAARSDAVLDDNFPTP
jgi:hypothetical protein